MKKRKIILIIMLGIAGVIGLIYLLTKLLSGLDVVGNDSLRSFKTLTKELKDNISYNENKQSWALSAPDNTVNFYFSKDFSQTLNHDVMLEFDSKPFIQAGLNINKLPNGYIINDTIMVGVNLGNEKIIYNNNPSPYDTYEKIVKLKRSSIKYHIALDHYGVDLGNGNSFEWAKDLKTNDKDIVFVLNPEPFIKAGVDPNKVKGWLYTKVPIMKNGKNLKEYKLLKAFNLVLKEDCSNENNICQN